MNSAPGAIEALDVSEPYDVCIIGSGFAGSILAQGLAEHGVRTLLLESGGSLSRWFLDPRVKQLAAYTVSGDADYLTARTKARALGGNSNFWTGRCERFHPSDFETHPYTPADNPWPVGYADLDPYYEQAERTLKVRGGPPSAHALAFHPRAFECVATQNEHEGPAVPERIAEP